MSAASENSEAQPTSLQPARVDKPWEVQAILAERMSTTLGVNEILVVCKPVWIPITLVTDGTVLRQHRDALKCRFMSCVCSVIYRTN